MGESTEPGDADEPGDREAIDQEAVAARISRLAQHYFEAAVESIEPVAPGLGTRRFFRVRMRDGSGRTAIARVEYPEDPRIRPKGVPSEPPLEPLRTFLSQAGIPVPSLLASDADILLLEDVGDETLETAVVEGAPEGTRAFYEEACDWIPRLQALSADASEIPAFGRSLDERLFAYKAQQLIEWGLPWGLGRAPTLAEAEAVRQAFSLITEECRAAPARLSHRDYKAANLHLRRDRPAGQRIVMIDLQGAFLAPPEYDLVCLLRDAHIALPWSEVEHHLARTRPALPDAPSRDAFERRFTLLTLSLCSKVISRFLFAAQQRGDRRYLDFLPNLTSSLHRAAANARAWDARLERLAELLDTFPTGAESPCER